MGNQVGKGANRMAIAAMSNVTHIEKRELAALQTKLREIASREGSPTTVNRTEFTEATTAIGINQNDSDILDRLFTMFDKTGDDVINFREFVVGISPLISGTPFDKLDFALRLYDLDGTGSVKSNELTNVLSNINRVASYFGDPVMTEEQLSNLVNDIFDTLDDKNSTAQLHYVDYVKIIVEHPVANTFVMGGGTVQYGMGR
jgi:Ca2+-binding EF-hand superfamily protein